MALADNLPDGARLALDTNALIYYVEEHDGYMATLAPVFSSIAEGRISCHVSTVTLLEVLVLPLRSGRPDLAALYRDLLHNSDNVTLYPVGAEVAERAATLRATRNLRVADAIVAATALEASCTHLLTNDAAFRVVDGIEVLVIREHADEKGNQ